jgi:AraC family transcriptional regulator
MLLNLKEGEYLGRNVKSEDNSFFKLSVTSYEPNCEIINHYHDNDYISILVKGQYHEKNSVENNLISAGDILFRPNAYNHENMFESCGGTCFNIEFKSEWQRQLDFSLGLPNKFINFKTGKFPSLYKLLVHFQNQNSEDLNLEFICDWLFQLNQKTVLKGHLPWIEKIIQIFENETDCFHTLKSLSERVFVHPIYIARAFKERQGMTVGEYQLKMKLENTVFLLLNTSVSINDITHINGFFDDAHFIRSFKSVYSISPHQFRLSFKKLI